MIGLADSPYTQPRYVAWGRGARNIRTAFRNRRPARFGPILICCALLGLAAVLCLTQFADASPYNWTPDSTWQTNGRVRTIDYAGGIVYLGGEFTQVIPPGGGTPVARNHLAAFSESTGQLLSWNPGADDIVWSLDVSGSTVYIGGQFQNVGGVARPYAAAVTTAGVTTSWNPQPNGTVNVVKVGPDGNVYLGGSFTVVGTKSRQLIASVSPAGVLTSWHPIVKQVSGTCPPRCSPFVTSFAFSPDGTALYFGGHFGSVNTIGRNNAAEVDLATGTTTMQWNPDVFGQGVGKNPNQANKVWSIALGSKDAYICGDWWSVDGFQRHPNIAAVDLTTGHLDTNWDVTDDGNTQSCVVSGNFVFIGGHFENVGPNEAWTFSSGSKAELTGPGSMARIHIAAVDATTGAIDAWNPSMNSTLGVHYMTTDASHLAVGGDFTSFGGFSQQGFAQLSFDTTPPNTVLDTHPPSPSNVNTASFTFHSTERAGAFQCSLDNAPFTSCSTPDNLTGLSDGSHTFQVAALDTAGNVDPTPASYTWQINTGAPNPPSNLNATVVSPSRVGLTWTASPDSDVVSYRIIRNGSLLATVPAPATSFNDNTVYGPTMFTYTVESVDNAANVSVDSNASSVMSSLTGPVLFGDGFETGDTTQWTSGSGLSVENTLVDSGAYSARATSTGTATYVVKTLASTTSQLYFHVRFDPISLGTQTNLIGFQTSTGVKLATIYVTATNKLGYRNEKSSTTTTSATSVALGTWHDLQARVLVNGASSEVEVWLDGVRVNDLAFTGQSLGSAAIGRVQVGGDLTGKTYDVVFDEAAYGLSYVIPGVPSSPFGVTAAGGVTSATVSWKPPYDGGSPITSYTVTPSNGGTPVTVGGSTLSTTVNGLSNGTSYTFTVTAANGIGSGPASAASNAVTPNTAPPGAPLNVTATPGNGSANVSWSAPTSDGGSSITSYTVTPSGGGIPVTVDGNTFSTTVTGLSNGTSYTFTVSAANANGSGPLSQPSSAVTPSTTPDAPTNVSATAGVSSANVSWTAPANNGGSPITFYTVTPSGGGSPVTVGGNTFSTTVSGLTNGTSYTFTVTASNTNGSGPPSQASNSVMPQSTTPGAPTGVTASPGPSSATVSWNAPGSDGGSAITSYTVTPSGGASPVTVSGSTLSANIPGLTNGTSYTFTVIATNANGNSPTSQPSNAVVPANGPPGAPLSVTASPQNGAAFVSWNAPTSNGGDTITSYTVTPSGGGTPVTVDGNTFGTTVPGLTNGTTYTFTVKAANIDGTGPASQPSNAVTPAQPPGAPTGIGAVEGSGSAIVSWNAPASNGGSPIVSYTVTPVGGPGSPVVVDGNTFTANVTGLSNGTSYTFTVTAANAAYSGAASVQSTAVVPYTLLGRSVTVSDSGISPASTFARTGDLVTWSFTGPNNNHSVTDATGLDLYDTGLQAPGYSFSYSYFAAGDYTFVDQGTTSVSGDVTVPITLDPATGTSSTTYAIRWASVAPPSNEVFDVQIKKPGATAYVSWLSGLIVPSGTFTSSDAKWSGTGTYWFRARLRNISTGHASGWSNGKQITVS